MRLMALAVGLVMLAGCATVTQPLSSLKTDYKDLPAEDMRAVAQEIEAAVQQGNRTPQVADRNGVVVSDELVVQAIRTRAARAELLNQFRSGGFAIEQRDGLLEIRTGGAYSKQGSSRDRDRNALLVYRENADRWTIYEGIMNKSHFPPRSLGAIRRAFFEARVAAMPAGQKYEDDSGADVEKTATP